MKSDDTTDMVTTTAIASFFGGMLGAVLGTGHPPMLPPPPRNISHGLARAWANHHASKRDADRTAGRWAVYNVSGPRCDYLVTGIPKAPRGRRVRLTFAFSSDVDTDLHLFAAPCSAARPEWIQSIFDSGHGEPILSIGDTDVDIAAPLDELRITKGRGTAHIHVRFRIIPEGTP